MVIAFNWATTTPITLPDTIQDRCLRPMPASMPSSALAAPSHAIGTVAFAIAPAVAFAIASLSFRSRPSSSLPAMSRYRDAQLLTSQSPQCSGRPAPPSRPVIRSLRASRRVMRGPVAMSPGSSSSRPPSINCAACRDLAQCSWNVLARAERPRDILNRGLPRSFGGPRQGLAAMGERLLAIKSEISGSRPGTESVQAALG